MPQIPEMTALPFYTQLILSQAVSHTSPASSLELLIASLLLPPQPRRLDICWALIIRTV